MNYSHYTNLKLFVVFFVVCICANQGYAPPPQAFKKSQALKEKEEKFILFTTFLYEHGFNFDEIAFALDIREGFVKYALGNASNYDELSERHEEFRQGLKGTVYSLLQSDEEIVNDMERGERENPIQLSTDFSIPFRLFKRFVGSEKLIMLLRIEALYRYGLHKREIDEILKAQKINVDAAWRLLPKLNSSETRRRNRRDLASALFVSAREGEKMILEFEILRSYITSDIREKLLKEVEGNFPREEPEIESRVIPLDPDPYGIEELIRQFGAVGIDMSTEQAFLERLRQGVSQRINQEPRLGPSPYSREFVEEVENRIRSHFRRRNRCNLFVVPNE